MYQLLNILNNCNTLPTADEIKMAEGQKVLDPKAANDWLPKLKKALNRFTDMFKCQLDQTVVSIIISLSFSIIHMSNFHVRTRLGVKRNLRGFLPNGWSCVTSPLRRSIRLSFAGCLNMLTCALVFILHTKSL